MNTETTPKPADDPKANNAAPAGCMARLVLRWLYPSFVAAHHRDLAIMKARNERLVRLSSDMLSVFGANEDMVTDERVECWKQEWSECAEKEYRYYH